MAPISELRIILRRSEPALLDAQLVVGQGRLADVVHAAQLVALVVDLMAAHEFLRPVDRTRADEEQRRFQGEAEGQVELRTGSTTLPSTSIWNTK